MDVVRTEGREADVIAYSKRGLCMPLALVWLKAQVLSPDYLPRKLGQNTIKFLDHATTLSDLRYYAEAGGNKGSSMVRMIEAMGFDSPNEWGGNFSSVIEGLQTSMRLCYNEGCVGVLLGGGEDMSSTKAPHAVAMAASPDGLRFFDGNVGAYLINSDAIGEFFNAWLKVYKEKFGYTWSWAVVLGMRNVR